MKIIVIDKPGKTTSSIVRPNYIGLKDELGLSEADALAYVIRGLPSGCEHLILEESELPTNRVFRDAWQQTGGTVGVNMNRARQIHMDRIRAKRNQVLEGLDITHLRALESLDQDEQRKVSTEKQNLRDIPQTFDLNRFRTPETLANAWPEGLPLPP